MSGPAPGFVHFVNLHCFDFASRRPHETAFVVLVLLALSTSGCVSLQVPSAKDGRPRLIGFGSAKMWSGPRGQVYRVVAPGLSFRAGFSAPGVTLGWHETLLFFPATNQCSEVVQQPVAVQARCYGIDLAPWHVALGGDRVFGVPEPATGKSVIQSVSFTAGSLTNVIVERKEIP